METATKERPILFSGDSIRAILDGKKTVTRRVVKGRDPRWEVDDREDGRLWPYYPCYVYAEPQPIDLQCPYGEPGDRLWVREAWRLYDSSEECACYDSCRCSAYSGQPLYRADWAGEASEYKWRPSIHMPRRLCRIVLEVKSVRVERLQEITEAEAKAEGITKALVSGVAPGEFHRAGFAQLWDQLNASRGYSWESNPWVWRVEFERIINTNQG